MRRADRLRDSKDFRRVSRQGLPRASPHFVAVVGVRRHELEGIGPVLAARLGPLVRFGPDSASVSGAAGESP